MAISNSGVIVIVIVCCGAVVCLAAGIGMHVRSRNAEPTLTMTNEEHMRPSNEQKKYMDWVRRDNWKMSMSQVRPMRQNYYPSESTTPV